MPTIINGDGVVTAGGTASTQGKVVLAEQTGSGTNTVTIQAPATLAADLTFTMPTADGANGQFLRTDGTGNLSFATATTSPAGSTGQVQYNNAGAFGAISDGTSGQFLTSAGAGSPPTWTSVSTGWTLLSTQNTTSGTTVSFTGIASTYNDLYFVFNTISFASAAILTVAFSSDGSSYTTAATLSDASDNSNIVGGILVPRYYASRGVALGSSRSTGAGECRSLPEGGAVWRLASGNLSAVRFGTGGIAFTAGSISLYAR